MVKRDDKENQPTRRTYKSSDVHRRRVGDSSRAKPAKMPSKREVREAARESTRIAAESRVDRSGKDEPAIDELEEYRFPVADEVPEENPKVPEEYPKPRFTVIKGAETRAIDDQPASPEKRDAEPVSPRAVDQEGEQQTGRSDDRRPTRRLTAEAHDKIAGIRPRTIAIAVVMVVAVIAVALFAFNRWGRYDDHADLQGTWYVLGTEVPITIDADTIRFNDEVSYHYEIDAREKTISYTFGPMSGQGRYWFSEDRKHLVITDGDGYTAAGTTVDDLIHAFLDFSTAAGGGIVELPQGEGIIAFSRVPEVIATNEPAEGLVVSQPDGSSDDSTAGAAESEAEQATEDGAPADQDSADEEGSAEGGAEAGDTSDDAAFEE